MIARFLLLWIAIGLAACTDQSVAGFAGGKTDFRLVAIDGDAVEGDLTLSLGRGGQIEGTTGCGAFSGRQDAPYPWIDITLTETGLEGCPDPSRAPERLVLLQAMHLAEVSGPVLLLSSEDGRRSMEFAAR